MLGWHRRSSESVPFSAAGDQGVRMFRFKPKKVDPVTPQMSESKFLRRVDRASTLIIAAVLAIAILAAAIYAFMPAGAD